MSPSARARIEHLGQTGLRIDLGELTVLVDPYLSHAVQVLDAPDLIRQVPIPYQPRELTMVDWVLITHEHIDHCDPHTLPLIAKASPHSQFLAPLAARKKLEEWGITDQRVLPALSEEMELGEGLKVKAIPAAHPKIRLDPFNQPQAVGYLLKHLDRTLYLAGDTSVCDELLDHLKKVGPIHTAFLPVNEDNYFRRRRGIVGNMSIREAFGLAAELNVQSMAAVHWDMFSVNSASPKEIEVVYNSSNWPFNLIEVSDAIL